MTISPSESMPAQIPPGESFATGGGGGGAGGGEVAAGPPDPPPPPPQATQNAVKLNTQRNPANAFMLLVQVRRQPGGLGVLRGVIRGYRRKRGPVAFRPRLSAGLALSVMCIKRSTKSELCQPVNLMQRRWGDEQRPLSLRPFKPSEYQDSDRLLSARSDHQIVIRFSSRIDQVFRIAVHQDDHRCSLPVLVRNQLEIFDEHENPNDIDRPGIHDDRVWRWLKTKTRSFWER